MSSIYGMIISHPNSTLIVFKSLPIIIYGTPRVHVLHHGFPMLYLSTVPDGQMQVPSNYKRRFVLHVKHVKA